MDFMGGTTRRRPFFIGYFLIFLMFFMILTSKRVPKRCPKSGVLDLPGGDILAPVFGVFEGAGFKSFGRTEK